MFYPAADRNKGFILDILKMYLDTSKMGKVLEISSGTGQHISHIAEHFPNLQFQPSEYDTSLFNSLTSYANKIASKNVKPPIKIDVTTDYRTWNCGNNYDCLLNFNMIHITPFSCSIGLFKNGSSVVKKGGFIITYGPYANNGVLEPESNVNFNRGLKAQNPEWGVRDIQDLKKIATEYHIELMKVHDMPANNKCLVWLVN